MSNGGDFGSGGVFRVAVRGYGGGLGVQGEGFEYCWIEERHFFGILGSLKGFFKLCESEAR